MSKAKGSRAERELFHMLWNAGWAVVRSAGSGSTPLPSPDLITSNGKKSLAIECKSIKGSSKHFPKEEIEDLSFFSQRFGAQPFIGVRFDHKGWFFLPVEAMHKTESENFSITLKLALEKGISFKKLIESSESLS